MNAISNISLLWFGTMSGAGLSFLAQVIFARKLGPAEYGILSSVLVLVSLFSSFAGFGVGTLWLRVFGKEGWQARRWLAPSIRFVVYSSIISCIFMFVWANNSDKNGLGTFALWFAPLIISISITELVVARLQLEERYALLSLWQFIPHAGRFLVALFLLFTSGNILYTGIGFFVYSIIVIGLASFVLYEMFNGKFYLAGHNPNAIMDEVPLSPKITSVPANSWPFALAWTFYLIYYQSNILMLNWLSGSKAAGIYYVAYTVITAIYLLPGVIFNKYLLPKQHRWAEHDRKKFFDVFCFSCKVMLCLGMFAMFTLMIIAPFSITKLFGSQYSTAGKLLVLLAGCLPARFLTYVIGNTMVTDNNMRKRVIFQGICAIFNIIANLLLIPLLSYWGSAIATVLTEILLLIMYYKGAKNNVFVEELKGKKFYDVCLSKNNILYKAE